ncbi:hypothetical protein Tco_1067889 [Tanacetum coccineum]|uniref:Retrotransposon gag domain-containing protein n=1 Tax=Tanacetum coccineum TaxID=301880 RepID=A0ABQ5HFU8_9ASTR
MEEINNFQQEPDETLYQAWERFKELLMKCPQHYLTEMQEVILFYNRLDVPTIGPHYTKDFPLKEEGKTLEEAYYMQFGGPFQGWGYIATALGCCHKEPMSINQNFRIQIEKMSKVLQERGFGSLPSSTEMNPRDQVKSISTTIEADS